MKRNRAQILWLILIGVPLAFCGCSSTGIRKLETVEVSYYTALSVGLAKSRADLTTLHSIAAELDELALREITRLEAQIQAAKTVYSVREMLTAPSGDRAAFIQNTRNRVLLYYLTEMEAAENQRLNDKAATVKALQNQLAQMEDQLFVAASNLIESEKLLHNHLNKSSMENVRDVFAEVEKQLASFDEALKSADQNNPFIQELKKESSAISSPVSTTDQGLGKLMDIWSKLNK